MDLLLVSFPYHSDLSLGSVMGIVWVPLSRRGSQCPWGVANPTEPPALRSPLRLPLGLGVMVWRWKVATHVPPSKV